MNKSKIKSLSVFSFILGAAFFVVAPAMAWSWEGSGADTYSRSPVGDISADVYSDTFSGDVTISATITPGDLATILDFSGYLNGDNGWPSDIGFWSIVIADNQIQAENPISTTTLTASVTWTAPFPIDTTYTIGVQLYDTNGIIIDGTFDSFPMRDTFIAQIGTPPEEPASSTPNSASSTFIFLANHLIDSSVEVATTTASNWPFVLLIFFVSATIAIVYRFFRAAQTVSRRSKK